jgi:hypothetical protein
MAKLKNTLAIQQMLAGEHRTQNKIQIQVPGLNDTVKQQRLIGETWTDVDGIEWEQKDGYVSRTSKVLDEVKRQTTYYSNCYERERGKECSKNNINSSRQDQHFRIKTGRCLDCQIAHEHKLRLEGKFEEYEKRTLYQNALDWFVEAEKDKDFIIAELFTNINYVAGADGGTETWTDTNYEERKKSINEAFYKYKEETLNKLREDLEIVENENIIN